MTDISARLLLDSMKDFTKIISHRKKIFNTYKKFLSRNKYVKILDNFDKDLTNSFWLCTILVKNKRVALQNYLRKFNIETNQVHFRNDRYSIFKKHIRKKSFPNMDKVENNYLVIPMNLRISSKDAEFISKKINSFF